MSDETSASTAIDPRKWAIQLGLATLIIAVLTAGLFYITTRGVFGRADGSRPAVDPKLNVVSLDHGMKVYAANCAICHGPTGLGDGPSAGPLNPKPRNFSTGWFKIGSTKTGLPTDEDIAATLRRGMLPALMPPWPQLADGEVKSVVLAVRQLAIEGRVADKLKRAPKTPREQALKDAHAQLDSGPLIKLPPKPAQIDLQRGQKFFTVNCVPCHDADGRGKLREDLVDNEENPISARDFTSGQFKGGTSIDDIAMRIVRGLPGGPMPTNPDISADDLWATAAYVRTFLPGREGTPPATAPTPAAALAPPPAGNSTAK